MIMKYTLTLYMLVAKEKKGTQDVKCYLNVKLLFFPAAVMSNNVTFGSSSNRIFFFINDAGVERDTTIGSDTTIGTLWTAIPLSH